MITALLNLIGCGAAVPEQAVIKLNPQKKFQTMTGWEATAQAAESYSTAFDIYKNKLFSDAVNDLGINRLRLEIRSGAENSVDYFSLWRAGKITESDYNRKRFEVINDNDDAFVINPKGFQFSEIDSTIEKVVLPMRELLKQRGESLYVNLNLVDFSDDRGNSNIRHNHKPEEYAELMLAAYQHIQSKYGFVPDAIEVILEPDNNTGWTAKQIGEVIVATAKRFREHNFKPAFIVPGTTNTANAPEFIDGIAAVPGAMQYITEFSYHRYCCASEYVLEEIAVRARNYNKQTSMLEWIGADYQTLHEDLKIGQNSAWQQFTLAFNKVPDNGAQYYVINDENPSKPVVTLGSRTRYLRQYFRYIRAGAQRIGAETNRVSFDPLAFINKNGNYVVVVKADAPGTVSVQNLPAGTYGISYTTAKETDVNAPDVTIKDGETLNAAIPSVGVLTVYAKNSASTKKGE